SKNKNLLFAGTEFGLFVSLDGGVSWNRMKAGLPTVAVHDLIIHPRDHDLGIGTHGRSIYVGDISPLEEMTPEWLAKPAHLFEVRPAVAFKVQKAETPKAKGYVAPNPPYGAVVYYCLKDAPGKAVAVTILDATGKQVTNLPGADKAGLHQVVWNLRADGRGETVRPREYVALMPVGRGKQLRKVIVEAE